MVVAFFVGQILVMVLFFYFLKWRAQEYAKGFYESVGFKQSSDVFMLDGIPHIKMTWTKER